MLGASLEDLATLSQRLNTTSTDTATTKQQAISLTAEVVGDVTAAAQRALDRINNEMGILTASVEGSVMQADAAQWTGANADRFRQAATEFAGSMSSGGQATTEQFATFRQAIGAMTESLDAYVASLSGALSDAERSAAAMAAAVEAQRANLDEVMNIGLSVG